MIKLSFWKKKKVEVNTPDKELADEIRHYHYKLDEAIKKAKKAGLHMVIYNTNETFYLFSQLSSFNPKVDVWRDTREEIK